MKPTDLAVYLRAFLTHYLPVQRGASPNTISGYRYAFVLLLRYCEQVCKIPLTQLCLEDIDHARVLAFLDHIHHCLPLQEEPIMLHQPTLDKLHTLRLTGMAAAFEQQLAQPAVQELSFEERFALLLDQEILYRDNRRLSRLLIAVCT